MFTVTVAVDVLPLLCLELSDQKEVIRCLEGEDRSLLKQGFGPCRQVYIMTING